MTGRTGAARLVAPVVLALILVLALTGLTGCVPAPKAGTIDILADSLGVQASWDRRTEFLRGAPKGADVLIDARAGIGLPDVLAAERKRAAAARPAILVIALGTNDAGPYDSGWNATDEQELRDLLATPALTACIVLVLPGHADKPGVPATLRGDLKAARTAIRKAASERAAEGRPTIVADWGAVALARPELTGADGIHLADGAPSAPGRKADEAAADAWTKVLWDGVARCPKP